ncbi:hypothetical protein FNF27_08226 [Cafeteria roenbergensis]|uniref:Uncharacterized protein n=1 Tax=Cafeteria roenbergensis TaxID=33653 RepID=A0A5A8D5W5_CAFRO|nr:hypothetical protein FNF27_08226 [Cafeteria roenbergensis]
MLAIVAAGAILLASPIASGWLRSVGGSRGSNMYSHRSFEKAMKFASLGANDGPLLTGNIASAYESAISACPSTAEALEGFLSVLPAPPGSAKNWESLSKVATMLSRARSISVRSGTHEASLGEGVCELLKHSIRREQLISVGIAAILSNPTTKMLDLAAQFKQRVKWDEFTIRVGLQIRQCVDCGWTNRAWNDQARLLLQLDCLRSVVARC